MVPDEECVGCGKRVEAIPDEIVLFHAFNAQHCSTSVIRLTIRAALHVVCAVHKEVTFALVFDPHRCAIICCRQACIGKDRENKLGNLHVGGEVVLTK